MKLFVMLECKKTH